MTYLRSLASPTPSWPRPPKRQHTRQKSEQKRYQNTDFHYYMYHIRNYYFSQWVRKLLYFSQSNELVLADFWNKNSRKVHMGLQSYRHMGKIITILEDIQYFCYQYSAHQGGRRGGGGLNWEAGAGIQLWQECWPVISTRGWSDSEKETEWKPASEATWRGETPMHRTGTMEIPHPQPELCSSWLTALLTLLTIGIFLFQICCENKRKD